jgi:sterol 24-C-methyltransferase
VGNANTTAPAAKPYLLVGSLLASALVLLAIDSTRAAIISFVFSHPFVTVLSALAGVSALLYCFLLLRTDEWRGGGASGLYRHADYETPSAVNSHIDSYESNFSATSRQGDGSHERMIAARQKNYMNMVNHFYDVVTDFYEYGWGDCFHFGFRFAGEGFQESLRRTEYYLALRLGLNHHTHAVDIGCGVGGPMRNIARFTGSKITGINNNAYQIKIGTKHNARWGLSERCDFLQSDFMRIPVPDNTFDHAYAIEATCHAPDKVACYAEAFRIIKPGGFFAAYDWCVTDKFDRNNRQHVATREGIEVGNGLPVLATTDECVQALTKAGFEVVDSFNAQQDAHKSKMDVPWYQSLAGEYTLTGFRMTPLGRMVTHGLVSTLEFMRIAPKGSVKVSKLLNDTAIDLVRGGKMEIFTPSFFFLARKPL